EEIGGPGRFVRLASGGSRCLRRPLPASGGERECTEISARLVDHSSADRVGRHESDYSLISRLKRSISAPLCGLSLSQSMVRILSRSSLVFAIPPLLPPPS